MPNALELSGLWRPGRPSAEIPLSDLSDQAQGRASNPVGTLLQTPSTELPANDEIFNQFNVRKFSPLYVSPPANRMLNRKLGGVQLFMITVNCTLGTGLYWRGGQILELAGPLAAALAFFCVGLLSCAVMQCITEMLCIWPVPGAVSVYVSEFVDFELGITVGIAYWFTYSVSFGASIATLAAEVEYWSTSQSTKIDLVIYLAVPLTLIMFNATDVRIYGMLEVVFGSIKILCLIIIVIILIVINMGGGGEQDYIGDKYWSSSLAAFDGKAAPHWAVAFFMCLSIALYAYVGIEVIAASALESTPDPRWARTKTDDAEELDISQRLDVTLMKSTVKFSAMYIPVFATIVYTVSGVLIALDIKHTDCLLPRLSWLNMTEPECSSYPKEGTSTKAATSAFVAIAWESGIPHLEHVFNAFLIFTCVTCAGTSLYVASRALFGLTSRLEGGKGQLWHLRALAYFGKTNRYKVPMRAVIFSSAAFIWVPFLQLRGGTDSTTSIGMFIEILAQMGSVCVLLVWTFEVVAFIRYHRCITDHASVIAQQRIPHLDRSGKGDNHYPYRSPFQPYLAYLALAGCLFIMIVANGASLWAGFVVFPFLSGYLFVFIFIGVWILLKVLRGAKWCWVDLSNPNRVVEKLRKLHDIRFAST
ncbi:amino acid permease-domain-containing protein [Aspergillus californicus]